MILISLLFVVISAVTLLIGVVFREDLTLIYASIASGLLGAVFLIASYVRGRRPARRPAAVIERSGDAGGSAEWSGARWGGGGEDAIARDDVPKDTTPVSTPVVTPPADTAVSAPSGLASSERTTAGAAGDTGGWAPPPPPAAPPRPAGADAPRVSPPSAPKAPPPPPTAPPPPA